MNKNVIKKSEAIFLTNSFYTNSCMLVIAAVHVYTYILIFIAILCFNTQYFGCTVSMKEWDRTRIYREKKIRSVCRKHNLAHNDYELLYVSYT